MSTTISFATLALKNKIVLTRQSDIPFMRCLISAIDTCVVDRIPLPSAILMGSEFRASVLSLVYLLYSMILAQVSGIISDFKLFWSLPELQ